MVGQIVRPGPLIGRHVTYPGGVVSEYVMRAGVAGGVKVLAILEEPCDCMLTISAVYPHGLPALPELGDRASLRTTGKTLAINGRTNMVAARVRTGSCSVGVAADPRTNTSFVTNACSNTVSVLVSCPGRADSRSAGRCRRDDRQAGTGPGSIAWPRSLSQAGWA